MGEFVKAVMERVQRARAMVDAAHEVDDPYEVAHAAGELEDALRVADDHGLTVHAMGEG